MDGLNNFEDFISPLVEQQFPAVYRDEGPILVKFLKAYYEYQEQTDGDLFTSRKMMERSDVDQSVDTFLEHFRKQYLNGIPKVSRANQKITSLLKRLISAKNIKTIKDLNNVAKKRGQSLSQMSIAWVLNNKAVTSALIGVRNLKQLNENVASLNNLDFTKSELTLISKKAREGNINLWLASSNH